MTVAALALPWELRCSAKHLKMKAYTVSTACKRLVVGRTYCKISFNLAKSRRIGLVT